MIFLSLSVPTWAIATSRDGSPRAAGKGVEDMWISTGSSATVRKEERLHVKARWIEPIDRSMAGAGNVMA